MRVVELIVEYLSHTEGKKSENFTLNFFLFE